MATNRLLSSTMRSRDDSSDWPVHLLGLLLFAEYHVGRRGRTTMVAVIIRTRLGHNAAWDQTVRRPLKANPFSVSDLRLAAAPVWAREVVEKDGASWDMAHAAAY